MHNNASIFQTLRQNGRTLRLCKLTKKSTTDSSPRLQETKPWQQQCLPPAGKTSEPAEMQERRNLQRLSVIGEQRRGEEEKGGEEREERRGEERRRGGKERRGEEEKRGGRAERERGC